MISVLMSVYNESIVDIKKSIESVLNQTYTDFEFIIVLDNPGFFEAKNLLDEYANKDDRIKIIVNEKNIGLALSMNKAFSVANGEYIVRMDADDICRLDRFDIQIKVISEGDYDLVCSDYDFIDENDEPIDRKTIIYSDNQINKLLPLRNVIHHPTVVMKSSSFKKLGGYRNYQCAQDYDLWLRMKIANCTFHMINDKLLHYRVRQSSITVKHRYKQVCTLNYIHSLYKVHGKNKMQNYSYEEYLKYLENKKANDKDRQENYQKFSNIYSESKKKLKKGRIISGFFGILKVLLFSKYYRPYIFRSLKISVITKFSK